MSTETVDSRFSDLDCLSTDALVDALTSSQINAVVSLHHLNKRLTSCIDAAADRLQQSSGRLVVAGAGTSGRIAVQDGAELWPTFGWPDERLRLKVAGGSNALLKAVEGAEDDKQAAIDDVSAEAIGSDDVVVALAASGKTPWTCAWVEESRKRGALTVGFANNPDTPLLSLAEFGIYLDSGAEVLAGSTRMAAGTTQKIALNVFSTALMVKLNRTYGNLMVDMAASNAKLQTRRRVMLQQIVPELSDTDAIAALDSASGHVKVAALLAHGLSAEKANELLIDKQGSLRKALQHLAG